MQTVLQAAHFPPKLPSILYILVQTKRKADNLKLNGLFSEKFKLTSPGLYRNDKVLTLALVEETNGNFLRVDAGVFESSFLVVMVRLLCVVVVDLVVPVVEW